jgi:DNA-binding NarL/FixJ family response regulator
VPEKSGQDHRVIGAGDICYHGLRFGLSEVHGSLEIERVSDDNVEESLLDICDSDIYILSSCKLWKELTPLCRQLRAISSAIRILVWSHGDQITAEEALRAGASAYVCSCSKDELLKALGALSQGYQYFSGQSIQAHQNQEDNGDQVALTARQAQVRKMAANGLSDKEISANLGISPHTVRSHLRSVFQRSGIRKRTELTAAI